MRILIIVILSYGTLFSQVLFSNFSDTIGSNDNIKYADSLFIYTDSKFTFLDFGDCNNCALRAHVMTFVFSKRFPELKLGKIWLFADSKLSSRRDYYKTHRKEFLNGNDLCPQWGFHVAPVIIFETDTIVIDPSIRSSPVKLVDWINTISAGKSSYLIIKQAAYYTYPDDEYDLFDDKEVNWDLKIEFSSPENEINFLAQKLATTYHIIFDPMKFYYYKNFLSKLIVLK